jgi:periplasmic divalent cation tolerance protein
LKIRPNKCSFDLNKKSLFIEAFLSFRLTKEGDQMQSDQVVLVLTNTPDLECAKTIARQLLAEGLAACINIGAPVLSLYEWESTMHESEEIPVMIKTTTARQELLIERLIALHPYELPEALVLPTTGGHTPYLAWVRQHTTKAVG